MPGCVLRAASPDFQIDEFLKTTTLQPCDLYRSGEPKGVTSRQLHTQSGLTVVVSEADGDELAQQVQDAIAFLEQNQEEIRQLGSHVGSEGMTLDFGIWRQEMFGQYCYLPPRLLHLAGEFKVGIEISLYEKDLSQRRGIQPKSV